MPVEKQEKEIETNTGKFDFIGSMKNFFADKMKVVQEMTTKASQKDEESEYDGTLS